MKYRGKYSLKENLIKGRGLGLLSELRSRGDDPSDDGRTINVQKTPLNAATFAGLKTQADIYSKLPTSHNDTGWRTQKKVAHWLMGEGFKIKWIASGRAQSDLLAEKGGKTYSFEVGNEDKSTQMGNTFADGTIHRTDDTSDSIIKKQRAVGAQRLRSASGVNVPNEDVIGSFADEAFEDSTRITKQETGAYWIEDGADILVMIVEGTTQDVNDPDAAISMIALSKEGNALSQKEGWSLTTMANAIDAVVSDNLAAGGDRFGVDQANKGGGSWFDSTGKRQRRSGFDAFPADIKSKLVQVN